MAGTRAAGALGFPGRSRDRIVSRCASGCGNALLVASINLPRRRTRLAAGDKDVGLRRSDESSAKIVRQCQTDCCGAAPGLRLPCCGGSVQRACAGTERRSGAEGMHAVQAGPDGTMQLRTAVLYLPWF